MRVINFDDGFTSETAPVSVGIAAADVAVTPSGNLAATDAQAALVELQGDVDTINAALTPHLADTSTHGVTGDIVGTTDAQALTSKTIVVASNTITTAPSGNLTSTELNAALAELQADVDSKATPADVAVPQNAIDAHLSDVSNPHAVTATQVGLGNVDNTSDATKNAAAATLTNKIITSPTIDGTGTIASGTSVVDATTPTKKLKFDVSGATAAKTMTIASSHTNDRTWTIPDTTDTAVGKATTDTLTNKTLTSPIVGTDATFANQAIAKFREQTGNGTNYIGLSAPDAVTADCTFKLPDGDGSANQVLKTDGSKNLGWASVATTVTTTRGDLISRGAAADQRLALGTAGKVLRSDGTDPVWAFTHVTSAKSASYTITDSDGIAFILMTTGSTARTVTLPAAANNTNRRIAIKKVDSGTGSVTISGSAETLVLYYQYESVTVVSDGTSWHLENANWTSGGTYSPTVSNWSGNLDSQPSVRVIFSRNKNIVTCTFFTALDPTTASTVNTSFEMTVPVPTANFVNSDDACGVTAAARLANTSSNVGTIFAVTGTQTVRVIFSSMVSTSSETTTGSFQYQIQ